MKKKQNTFYIALFLSLIVLAGSIFSYASRDTKEDTFSITYTDIGFDTVISFKAECTQKEFEEYSTLVKDTFEKYNAYFDIYHEYDGIINVCTLNKSAYQNPMEVDPILLDCIEQALQYNELNTNFDITQGNLLNLWHSYREKGESIPTGEEIQQASIHSGSNLIKIDGNTIEYLDENVQLDLGGIAKGYTCQKVKEILNEKGLDNGFINAGGNIVLLGEKKDGANWNIGIQDPDNTSLNLSVFLNKPTSIVTSGDYQRYYEVNGIRYSHIINPKTGYPATYNRSVTIITEDSTKADVLSTALFCMSYEDGLQFISNYDDVEVIWICDKGFIQNPDYKTDNYDICCTKGIKDKINLNN